MEQAVRLGTVLRERDLRLAVAESCTGGSLAALLTEAPGSSHWFECGFVVYSNEAKKELLGVSEETLHREGAVSVAAAREMAAGALAHSHAQLAAAVTGIAGPDGGTPDKPVGTVCLAWELTGSEKRSSIEHFSGDRLAVRRAACARALVGLWELLQAG